MFVYPNVAYTKDQSKVFGLYRVVKTNIFKTFVWDFPGSPVVKTLPTNAERSEVTQSCPILCNPMDCVAYQAALSIGFSRQGYWSGLPFPSPGDLLNLGVNPGSPTLQAVALPSEPPEMLSVAEGVGSIPVQGAKIPHASQPKNQSIKQKKYCNKFNEDFKKRSTPTKSF